MVKKNKNHYETLGIGPSASLSEIKLAYRNLVKDLHPDRLQAGDLQDEYHEKLIDLNNAYGVLKDPQKRQMYDIELENKRIELENQINSQWANQDSGSNQSNQNNADSFRAKKKQELGTFYIFIALSIISLIYHLLSQPNDPKIIKDTNAFKSRPALSLLSRGQKSKPTALEIEIKRACVNFASSPIFDADNKIIPNKKEYDICSIKKYQSCISILSNIKNPHTKKQTPLMY